MILPVDTKPPIDDQSDEEDFYLPDEDYAHETIPLTGQPTAYGYIPRPLSPASHISQLLLAQDDDLELGPAPPYTPIAETSFSTFGSRYPRWSHHGHGLRTERAHGPQSWKRLKRKWAFVLGGAVAGVLLCLVLVYLGSGRKGSRRRPGRHGWNGPPIPPPDEMEGDLFSCVDMADAGALFVPLDADGHAFAQMAGMGLGEIILSQAQDPVDGVNVVFECAQGSACLFKRKRDGATGLAIHSQANWTTARDEAVTEAAFRVHLFLPPPPSDRPVSLDLRTDSGNITVQDVEIVHHLDLHTGRGCVDLGNIRAERLHVGGTGNTTGQVTISDEVAVETPLGDVHLNVTLARPLMASEAKCSRDYAIPPISVSIHAGSGETSLRYLPAEAPCRRLRQDVFSLLGSVTVYPDIAFEGPVHLSSTLGGIHVAPPSMVVADPAGRGRNRTVTMDAETTTKSVTGQVRWVPSIVKHVQEEHSDMRVKTASGDIEVIF